MPSAKFNEVYQKTREIKSGPSNDDLLNVRLPLSISLSLPRVDLPTAQPRLHEHEHKHEHSLRDGWMDGWMSMMC